VHRLTISLKRVQTFIFAVPRLKAMLGANALIGHTMRHELPKMMQGSGCQLDWPADLKADGPPDPLAGSDDPDNPGAPSLRG